MISDEELQEMVVTEGRDYAEPEQLIETMAAELLELREEKRQAEEARAKSWDDAPGDGCPGCGPDRSCVCAKGRP